MAPCNKVGCCDARCDAPAGTPVDMTATAPETPAAAAKARFFKALAQPAPLPRALTTDDHVRIDVLRERIARLEMRRGIERELMSEAERRYVDTSRALDADKYELTALVGATS